VSSQAFHNEAVMWKFLKHEHIVPFIGVSPLFPVCLISEWMPHGSVSSFLRTHPCADRIRFVRIWPRKYRSLLTEPQLREIVSGLKYMHSMDVIHGDLKAVSYRVLFRGAIALKIRQSNILVDAEHHVRLTDFGLSTILFGTGSLTNTGSPAGTVRWMAPERLRDSEDSHPSVRSDIYALGMVIYEVLLFTLNLVKPTLSSHAALQRSHPFCRRAQSTWHHLANCLRRTSSSARPCRRARAHG
jgi:serine/threonine protein kinase